MPLIAKVDSLDNIEEALRKFYKPNTGGEGFTLDVTSVDGWELQDVSKLQSALNDERKARKDAEKSAKKFEGFDDPDEVKKKLEKLDRLEKAGESEKEKIEAHAKSRIDSITASYEEKLAKANEANATATSQLREFKVGQAIGQALSSHTLTEGSSAVLDPFLRNKIRLNDEGEVRVFDDKGNEVYSKEKPSEPMTPSEYVEGLKSQAGFKGLFAAPDARGSNATTNNGNRTHGNPADMTAQEKMRAGLKG